MNIFEDRLKKVRQEILDQKLDTIFISSNATVAYLSGYSNFSSIEREAYLVIGQDFQYLVTDGRYTEAVKKAVPHFDIFERGSAQSTEDLFEKIIKKVKRLGIEEDDLKVTEYKFLKKHFKNLKHFESNQSRSIKDEDELLKIEKACKLGDEAFKFILKKIKAGVTEKEIAFELENFFKKNGADISFDPIVAFGVNSAIPHHQTGNTTLKEGQFVLLDFGAKYEDYCSDMTRTFVFGKSNQKQKEIYEIVYQAQQKAVEIAESSIKLNKKLIAAEIDKAAREYIRSKGYPDIPHSVGHGIGLQVHEHPFISLRSNEVLKEGMVFSIEPGIYLPGFGGVRIEDLFVIEKNGLKKLTNAFSPPKLPSV